tara:strand:+ start:376 stop:573 length:198 start_codon:yes stop_codon:yes gene_type:complete
MSSIQVADIVSPVRELDFGELTMSVSDSFWVVHVDVPRGLIHGLWWKTVNNAIILVSIEDVRKVG